MPSTDHLVDRARSDFSHLMSNWFADLMSLRRDGILEHTWRSNRDEDFDGMPGLSSAAAPHSASERRRAA